jgi:ABC-type multidrug transport system fused ATPase/permease subunit
VRSARLQSIVEPASMVAVQGSFVLVLGIGGARLAAGAIELSDLVSFLLYLVGPLVMIFTSFTDLQRGLAAVDRIKEVLAAPIETEDRLTIHLPPSPSETEIPAVRFDSVRFGYVPGHAVLRGVSFEVPTLSRTALVGPSGSGNPPSSPCSRGSTKQTRGPSSSKDRMSGTCHSISCEARSGTSSRSRR